ncbi:helix-turn-helix transcriptional regulator [Clostridium minihomine]|uniref:helix-turn-helix transcriptional regulator n=1 Tax=Clostridium minihomine TaxID=2045012 RepID=UPI000C756772|nr:AraC family transcriptional regulator [Clostridium minihomine]
MNVVEQARIPYLLKNGFEKKCAVPQYNAEGQCFQIHPDIGTGYYWIYSFQNLFSFTIHDFILHDDFLIDCNMPEYLSMTYFESISGAEINPYRRLNGDCLQVYCSATRGYHALIHKEVPVRSIGIEITPDYYETYLPEKYPEDYRNPCSAFINWDETAVFPEMLLLLHQVKQYRGTGMAARLFYEGKAAEAVSLIVEKTKLCPSRQVTRISQLDFEQMEAVTVYIDSHFSMDLKLEQLCKIACMGKTKLKTVFRQMHHCTITEYIQRCRIRQAEHLLTHTDFSIGQISQTVGYRSASRFSVLFRKNTGLHPFEYRKLSWIGK